jgi:DivIVA domain-containing protein
MDEGMTWALDGQLAPTSSAVIFCRTIDTCHALGGYRRATEWMEAIADCLARTGIEAFPGDCEAHSVGILVGRGARAEGERRARRACAAMEPMDLTHVGLALADGDVEAARSAAAELSTIATRYARPALAAAAECAQATVLLAEGAPAMAAASLQPPACGTAPRLDLSRVGRRCAVGGSGGVCSSVPEMRSSWVGGPSDEVRRVVEEDAMSVYQQDAEAGQDNGDGAPAFRVVRRGYDRDEVDAYMPQLKARLEEAVDLYAKAEQARAELQREVNSLREGSPSFEQLGGEAAALLQEAGRSAEQLVENARRRAETIIEKAQQQAEQTRADVENEAQKALEQAREVADHIRREVEEERAALFSETEQVRDFRDGLLDDLGRVHGEISGLLERTRKQRDQALTIGGLASSKAVAGADPKAADAPAEPAKVAEPQ